MRELTEKQIAYCKARADGKGPTDAFKVSGYKTEGLDSDAISSRASVLESRPHIQKETDRLRRLLEQKNIWSRAEIIQRHKEIAAMAHEAAWADGKYNASAAAVEQKSLDAVSKMCGYDAPQQVQQEITVVIEDDAEDFAE